MTAPATKGAGAAVGRRRVVAGVLTVVLALLVTRAWVVEPLRIDSESMSPTLRDGDLVLVGKVAGMRDLRRSDLVVFHSPDGGRLAVKRVVAVAGDTVGIRDAELFVNEAPVAEPYVDHERIDGLYFGPVTVGPGAVFLLGDNRARSIDSRSYGAVPLRAVVGRVWHTVSLP